MNNSWCFNICDMHLVDSEQHDGKKNIIVVEKEHLCGIIKVYSFVLIYFNYQCFNFTFLVVDYTSLSSMSICPSNSI